jgi:hypothetical protein
MPLPSFADLHFAIERAAAPIVPAERPAFIQAVVTELERHAILGEGILYRTVASLQRQFTVEARSVTEGEGESRHLGRRPTHRSPRRQGSP